MRSIDKIDGLHNGLPKWFEWRKRVHPLLSSTYPIRKLVLESTYILDNYNALISLFLFRFCEATFDWGGVSKDFWTQAARNKGYNLDAKSLIFEDDKLFRKRYHMFVRKNR